MALYVPNPERGSVEDLIEQLAQDLTERYQQAENTLLAEVAQRARRDLALAAMLPEAPAGAGLTVAERRERNRIMAELAARRAVAVRELRAIADRLVGDLRASGLAEQIVAAAAQEGEAAAAAQLGFARDRAPLAGTQSQGTAQIVLSLESRLEALNWRLTRYPQDIYQRIVSVYTPSTVLGVTTSKVQQAAIVQRFLAEGVPSFTDRAGRRWTIGAYSEMAGRTTVNRAFNDAAVARMQQSGINLVQIVRGLDSCQKCSAWAGRVLSTDGTQPGTYTVQDPTGGQVDVSVDGTVDDARASGWGHPNCRCRLAPYMPGVSVLSQDTTYDPEAEKERAEQRRLEREIRSAKRDQATAMNDTDAKKAHRAVTTAQADMREFIRTTGRNRDSYREQLHFADGRRTR